MIPKQAFFIWIGETPSYTDFVINTFREVNPTFTFNLIHLPEEVIVNKEFHKAIYNNNDIVDAIEFSYDCIEKTLTYNRNNKYYKYIKMITDKKNVFLRRGFSTYFSDILRLEIIERMGGIYLDLDTFPIKPFDDELLKLDHFNAIITKKNCREFFFFGAKKGINSWFTSYDTTILNESLGYTRDDVEPELFDKFNKGILKYGDVKGIRYIEHFRTKYWRNENYSGNHLAMDKLFKTNYE